MQRHAPMLRRRKQRIREALAAVGFQQRSREPSGLVGVPERARLFEVASPENVARRRAWAVVGDDDAGNELQRRSVPTESRRSGEDFGADTMAKSCGEAETQSKNGFQTAFACCSPRPWKAIEIAT